MRREKFTPNAVIWNALDDKQDQKNYDEEKYGDNEDWDDNPENYPWLSDKWRSNFQ